MYLEVVGRSGEVMITKGLNASGLELLRVSPPKIENEQIAKATVFATETGIKKLRGKIEAFAEKETDKGRPCNADLVQSISAITEAGLKALWRSPDSRFPRMGQVVPWEIWLSKSQAVEFIDKSFRCGVLVGSERLEFPEDIVVVAMSTDVDLALAIRRIGGVKALAAPTITADYFEGMPIEEQGDWLNGILRSTTYEHVVDPAYITILDTGINRAHPLIQPALSIDDRYAAIPSWSVEDQKGHGTQLAGLALFGDLTGVAQSMAPIAVRHKLESSKIIPDKGENPHHLLGAITRDGISAVELEANRRRTFAMAVTTCEDTPHDGAPTSWSTEIDQLASGVSGFSQHPRLLVISAGNTNQSLFNEDDYISSCHHPENEIESPAQAWNAICVGAYTEKCVLPIGVVQKPVAPLGDLSPSSRTASWLSHWPIKPEVVFEGGNWLHQASPPPMRHEALGLLTTDHTYPKRAFTIASDTSAATALAARAITEIWSDYPELWPETVRALFVSSARWTPQMRSHLPAEPSKSAYGPLFQRYGYGVPEMERARRSASNALTLIIQDTITPYRQPEKRGREHIHNEMKLFELPWPVEALRRLGNTQVTLRVSLSTFIEPNPSEPARGSKYRYASHNLRFKLNRANESRLAFVARINKAAEDDEGMPIEENDGWIFGSNRRDVGSLHIDELVCPASDLARRNILAVHPVSGWWKTKIVKDPENRLARFALIVEIDAGTTSSDLYAEVDAAVQNITKASTAVKV